AGLTTITGRPAPLRLAATTLSKPPVASTATAPGHSGTRRPFNASRPSASRATTKLSPDGCTCTSSRSFDTSIPTTVASIFTPPCAIGLRFERPKRLFGFDGTTDGAPCFPRSLATKGDLGFPSATADRTIPDPPRFKLQGDPGGKHCHSDRHLGPLPFALLAQCSAGDDSAIEDRRLGPGENLAPPTSHRNNSSRSGSPTSSDRPRTSA